MEGSKSITGSEVYVSSGINKGRKEYYREILSQLGLGLENKMDVKVGSLSGGQRQAMALLMSTMTPIEFLILDEHTAALDPKTAELIQAVFNQAAYFGTRGVPVRPVPFQAPADFPDFLGWLTVSAGEAAALDGSQFRTESGFDYEVGLYIQQGFRVSLRTPRDRPDLPDGTEILPGRILYTTNGGMADVPVLLVDRELCPAFAGAYPGYDAIFYAYGETHDTLGMGLTIPQGWYALSAGTMSMAPFDLAASPIVIGEEALAQITPGTVRWDALYPMAEPEITGEPDAAVKFRFQM